MSSEIGQGEMDDLYKSIFSRNIGFFTELEQEKLRRSTIGVAGVGGVGGLLVERLIRLGVGHLRFIDPEDFEPSNMNRQFGSSTLSLNRSKSEVVFSLIKDINPEAKIDWGISSIKNQRDASEFVSGCDVVIDEMEFGLFREKVFLQRACRQREIYYVSSSAIGFGALVIVCDPNGGTLEEYNRLPIDIDPNSDSDLKVPLESICPVIPSYAVPASVDAERIVQEILSGRRGAPSNSIGAGLASLLAANEAVNILIRKREIVAVPRYTYVDLVDQRFVVGTVFEPCSIE